MKKHAHSFSRSVSGLFIPVAALAGLTGCQFDVGIDSHADVGEQAIVGGTTTTVAEHPWQISLQTPDGFHFCGGSIIDASWVLTAQHCMEGEVASDLMVVAGVTRLSQASQGQSVGVSQIIRNPGFSSPENGHDVTLLHLAQPLVLGGDVEAIAFASAADVTAGATNAGVPATISGWGTLSSGGQSTPDTLHVVTVPIIDLVDAENALGSNLTQDQLAAGADGKDSCQGDSGGPLTVQSSHGTILAGVVSWGIGCGDPGSPGLYARVSAFEQWIRDTMAGVPSTGGGGGGGGGGTIGGSWMCDPSWVGDGSCDCGCGAQDSDCADATIGSCQYNDCDAWQPTQGLQLDNTDPTQCAGGTSSGGGGGGGGGGGAGQCPANASLTADGTGCACDTGFVPDAAGSSCVADAGTGGGSGGGTGATCPDNATSTAAGACQCNAGFHPDPTGASCLGDVGGDSGGKADAASGSGQPKAQPAGCAGTTGAGPLGLLALGALLVRRRRARSQPPRGLGVLSCGPA